MKSKHNKRNNKGSMLFFIIGVVAAILVPLIIFFGHLGPYIVYRGRAQNVVEAAGMLAASDLSRIVIEDENFGYVSLSNHQPTGKATLAQDGEPLPVTGINTIIGTLRQNAIIADELNNDTMHARVDTDLYFLDRTIKKLNGKLSDCLSGDTLKGECRDIDGKDVNIVADVEKFLSENLPPNVQVESLNLKLGWLEGGSDTNIPVPQPLRLAQLKPAEMSDGKYEAFKDVPVGRRPFSFAGLSPTAHMVSSLKFRDADGKHVNSIVRIECTLVSKDGTNTKTECAACFQPYALPDSSGRGAMTVRFAGRPVPGVLSWNDFLSDSCFQDNRVTGYDIVGGDYPYDREAKMHYSKYIAGGTSDEFAEHLYNWLRSGHLRPKVESVLAMLNEPFRSVLNEVYIYEFADDGTISRRIMDGHHFTRAVIAEGQYTATADTRIKSGFGAVVIFRDNVKRLNVDSGKHGGQPLAGYPLGNQEGEVDHAAMAQSFAKRKDNRDGLAIDIEIGGTGDSTAKLDILRMIQKTRNRKV